MGNFAVPWHGRYGGYICIGTWTQRNNGKSVDGKIYRRAIINAVYIIRLY